MANKKQNDRLTGEYTAESKAVALGVAKINNLPDSVLFYGFHIVRNTQGENPQFLLIEAEKALGSSWAESPHLANHSRNFTEMVDLCRILESSGFSDIQLGLTYLKVLSKNPLKYDMILIINQDQSWKKSTQEDFKEQGPDSQNAQAQSSPSDRSSHKESEPEEWDDEDDSGSNPGPR